MAHVRDRLGNVKATVVVVIANRERVGGVDGREVARLCRGGGARVGLVGGLGIGPAIRLAAAGAHEVVAVGKGVAVLGVARHVERGVWRAIDRRKRLAGTEHVGRGEHARKRQARDVDRAQLGAVAKHVVHIDGLRKLHAGEVDRLEVRAVIEQGAHRREGRRVPRGEVSAREGGATLEHVLAGRGAGDVYALDVNIWQRAAVGEHVAEVRGARGVQVLHARDARDARELAKVEAHRPRLDAHHGRVDNDARRDGARGVVAPGVGGLGGRSREVGGIRRGCLAREVQGLKAAVVVRVLADHVVGLYLGILRVEGRVLLKRDVERGRDAHAAGLVLRVPAGKHVARARGLGRGQLPRATDRLGDGGKRGVAVLERGAMLVGLGRERGPAGRLGDRGRGQGREREHRAQGPGRDASRDRVLHLFLLSRGWGLLAPPYCTGFARGNRPRRGRKGVTNWNPPAVRGPERRTKGAAARSWSGRRPSCVWCAGRRGRALAFWLTGRRRASGTWPRRASRGRPSTRSR